MGGMCTRPLETGSRGTAERRFTELVSRALLRGHVDGKRKERSSETSGMVKLLTAGDYLPYITKFLTCVTVPAAIELH